MQRRGLVLVRVAIVSLAVLAGCGGGSDDNPGTGGASGGASGHAGAGSGGASAGTGGHANGGSGGAGASGSGGATAVVDAGTGGAPRDAGSDATATGTDARDAAADTGADAGPPSAGVVAAGVRWFGRIDTTTSTAGPRFSWSGNGFVARFSGTGLTAQLNNSGAFIFKTVVDGQARPTFTTTAGQASYALATGLAAGTHTLELYRQTEGSQGGTQLLGLTVAGGSLMTPPPAPGRFIEIIGDSISCGYGTLGTVNDGECFSTESHWDSYGAVAARALGADLSTVAISGQGVYKNFGGDMNNTLPMVYTRALTNDAAPLWDFRTQPQVVIINLGTNDISNNKGDPGAPFVQAYVGLTQAVRAHYPSALIVCIIGPLLGGTDLTTIGNHIQTVVDMRHAAGDANIEFFNMLTPQTPDKFACQSHPNPAENQIMANLLTTELRARLGW